MSDETMVTITNAATGREIDVTLDELEQAATALADRPRLRDIALVKRTPKQHGVAWRVAWTYAKSTPSGVPDERDDGLTSMDGAHPDLEAAVKDVTDKVVEMLMPEATEASFKSIQWKEGTAVVEVVASHSRLSKPVTLKCFLAEKTFVDEVFLVEREAYSYADQRKREQMEMAL